MGILMSLRKEEFSSFLSPFPSSDHKRNPKNLRNAIVIIAYMSSFLGTLEYIENEKVMFYLKD